MSNRKWIKPTIIHIKQTHTMHLHHIIPLCSNFMFQGQVMHEHKSVVSVFLSYFTCQNFLVNYTTEKTTHYHIYKIIFIYCRLSWKDLLFFCLEYMRDIPVIMSLNIIYVFFFHNYEWLTDQNNFTSLLFLKCSSLPQM